MIIQTSNKIDTALVICKCSSSEHQMIFRSFKNEDEIYVDVHLTDQGFFRRLKHGIKYIFGYKSKYGAWDEIILDKKEFKQIVKNIK